MLKYKHLTLFWKTPYLIFIFLQGNHPPPPNLKKICLGCGAPKTKKLKVTRLIMQIFTLQWEHSFLNTNLYKLHDVHVAYYP